MIVAWQNISLVDRADAGFAQLFTWSNFDAVCTVTLPRIL